MAVKLFPEHCKPYVWLCVCHERLSGERSTSIFMVELNSVVIHAPLCYDFGSSTFRVE